MRSLPVCDFGGQKRVQRNHYNAVVYCSVSQHSLEDSSVCLLGFTLYVYPCLLLCFTFFELRDDFTLFSYF